MPQAKIGVIFRINYKIGYNGVETRRVMMKIKELTAEQLRLLMDEALEERLEEIIGDLDRGLKLSDEAKLKIKESLMALKRGEKGISLEELAEEMGIELE